MCAVDLRVVFVIVVIINIVENKIYDIHKQCKEVYGLDLDGVLRQFRRSDDYLQILKWTVQGFYDFYMDVMVEGLDYNIEQMKQRIGTDMGISTSTTSTTTTTQKPETPPDPDKVRLRRKFSGRRQDDEPDGVLSQDSIKNRAKVKRLDNYSKLKTYLTVEERNRYKDLGFTYAGEVIHTVIKAFGGSPVEELVRSTRLIQQTQEHPTTQHMLKHIATKPPVPERANKVTKGVTEEDATALRRNKGKRFFLVGQEPEGIE